MLAVVGNMLVAFVALGLFAATIAGVRKR